MTASPVQLSTLNEADYQRYRMPDELGSFGSLNTPLGHLPLQSMDIEGEILGLLYRLKLRQRFFNVYQQPLEAVYIFPMPARAAVSAFVMQTQERRIVGELQERGQARRAYQQAIAEGKQAALAEEERAEVFTMTVGNIPAGQWVDIELTLDGPLSWLDDQAMFRFPLVVAPRYIPGSPLSGSSVGDGVAVDTDAVPDASRISPPVLLPGYPNPVRLRVDLQVLSGGLAFQPPSVSLPDLQCLQEDAGLRLQLSPTANRLDRDLILRFPLTLDHIQTTVNGQHQDGEHYLMVNLVPDRGLQRPPLQPRQVVVLLDRSGSMQGWKMVCARRAVGRLVDSLNEQDHFQVLTFDTQVEPLNPAKTGLIAATDRERFSAIEKLGGVEDRGGTEILRAIQQGTQLLQGQQQPYLLLITDGQVGNESEVLRWIQQEAVGIRMFCVGIDKAVNHSLLERIAQVSGGHFTLVESEEQLDDAMDNLRRRIHRPLLTRVRIAGMASSQQVDLFEGACSRLFAKASGEVPQQIVLEGKDAHDRPWRQTLPVIRYAGDCIRKMWARERVLELEHGFLAGWRDPACQPAGITQVSLKYGVLCRFTAFVAVDHQSKVEGDRHRVVQAVSQPEGWAEADAQAPQEKAKRGGLVKQAKMPMGPKPTLGKSSPMARPASADAFAAPMMCFAPSPMPEEAESVPFAAGGDPFAVAPPGAPCPAPAPPPPPPAAKAEVAKLQSQWLRDEAKAAPQLTFEQLNDLDDNSLLQVLRLTDIEVLAAALLGADPQLVERVLDLMQRSTLRERLEALVGLADGQVQQARQEMCNIARGLWSLGKLKLRERRDRAFWA